MKKIEIIENTSSNSNQSLVDSSDNIVSVINDVKIVNDDNKMDISSIKQLKTNQEMDESGYSSRNDVRGFVGDLSIDRLLSKDNEIYPIDPHHGSHMHINICSCSIIFNCFTQNTVSKN